MYRDIKVDIVHNRLSVTWQYSSALWHGIQSNLQSLVHINNIRGGLKRTQHRSNIIGKTLSDMTIDRRLAEESWCRSWLGYNYTLWPELRL